jgi:glycosyltransferase involved in cell wall biosynthesis
MRGTLLLVANYDSEVGYAWWLMEGFWALAAHAMARQGRRCILAYPTVGSVSDVIRNAPMDVIERRISWAPGRLAVRSGFFMKQNGITSVYLTDWPALHWIYAWWRLMGVRSIVLHDHTPGDMPPVGGIRGMTKRLLHALRVFSASQYVAVAAHIRRRHIETWRVPSRRCTVVENGIRAFDCLPAERAAVRQEIGIPDSAVLVALVGRATHYKHLDFAVRCLARLRQRAPNAGAIHFVHCGDGPQLEELRSLTKELDLADRMHFLGKRSDVRDILCASDLAFHPSRGEAMSLAILEFMSAGLAVVASDRPSVCAAVEHGASGLLYPADDLDAAADAVSELATDPRRRRSLGEEGRRRCHSRYTIERTYDAFTRGVIAHL